MRELIKTKCVRKCCYFIIFPAQSPKRFLEIDAGVFSGRSNNVGERKIDFSVSQNDAFVHISTNALIKNEKYEHERIIYSFRFIPIC